MSMRVLMSTAALICSGGLFSYCSDHDSNVSHVSDVSTPGGGSDANVLFWIDQDKLFKASCVAGMPTNRANCVTGTSHVLLVTARKNADDAATAAIQSTNVQISAEIKALKDADSTIVAMQGRVRNLEKQHSDVLASSNRLQTELTAKTAEKNKLAAQIANYDLQIAAINKRLEQNPNDVELLQLRTQLQDERAVVSDKFVAIEVVVADLQSRLTWEQGVVAKVAQELKDQQDELKTAYDNLIVNSERLNQLRMTLSNHNAAKAAIGSVFEYISQSDITYRGNLMSPAQQAALAWIGNMQPAAVIKPGRYVVESGYSSYCPQKVEPQYNNGNLHSVRLTYLSPCSNQYHDYMCTGLVCRASLGTMTIQSIDHYEYNGGPNRVAIFKFSAPAFNPKNAFNILLRTPKVTI